MKYKNSHSKLVCSHSQTQCIYNSVKHVFLRESDNDRKTSNRQTDINWGRQRSRQTNRERYRERTTKKKKEKKTTNRHKLGGQRNRQTERQTGRQTEINQNKINRNKLRETQKPTNKKRDSERVRKRQKANQFTCDPYRKIHRRKELHCWRKGLRVRDNLWYWSQNVLWVQLPSYMSHRGPHSEHRFPAPSSKLCQV